MNLLKPPGMTSHGVVARVRRLLGERRVGHAGTLDPDAAGVLPLALGRATRLVDYLHQTPKTYRAEAVLGLETTTQDLGGQLVARLPVARHYDIEAALERFRGTIKQVPPMHSAVHYQGRRLYELARQGLEVDRQPREVTIYDLRLLEVFDADFPPRVLFEVTCSSGTYVRTLCHDLGRHLGCGACLSFLLRTKVGPFAVDEALTLEELEGVVNGECRREGWLQAMETAVAHLPRVWVRPEAGGRAGNGVALAPAELADLGPVAAAANEVAVFIGDSFLGIGCWERADGTRLHLRKVLGGSAK